MLIKLRKARIRTAADTPANEQNNVEISFQKPIVFLEKKDLETFRDELRQTFELALPFKLEMFFQYVVNPDSIDSEFVSEFS